MAAAAVLKMAAGVKQSNVAHSPEKPADAPAARQQLPLQLVEPRSSNTVLALWPSTHR